MSPNPKTKLYLSITLLFFVSIFYTIDAQKNDTKSKDPKSLGVSVSPPHFHFTQEQGQIKTYDITIKNTTSTAKSFNVNVYDFDMNGKGKSSFLPPGEGKYSLSKWMNISPTFIELEPFKTKKVKVTVSVPSDDNGRKVASIGPTVNSNLNLNFSLRKEFGVPIPFTNKTAASAKFASFLDINGNNIKDKDEVRIQNVVVKLNKHEVITNFDGEASIKNVQQGKYKLEILPLEELNGWFSNTKDSIFINEDGIN